MTVEHLSHASADRYADRMMHDVKTTSQIRFPPRPPPTASARESLETFQDIEEHAMPDGDAFAISARVEETPPPASIKKPIKSIQERFQDFYTDFETLEPMLSTYLSADDRKRFVRAFRGPSPFQRPEMITIVVSILVVMMTAMVCLNHSSHSPRGESRSRAAPSSHSSSSPPPPPPPPSQTSSTTNYNIDRIIAPLNRNR